MLPRLRYRDGMATAAASILSAAPPIARQGRSRMMRKRQNSMAQSTEYRQKSRALLSCLDCNGNKIQTACQGRTRSGSDQPRAPAPDIPRNLPRLPARHWDGAFSRLSVRGRSSQNRNGPTNAPVFSASVEAGLSFAKRHFDPTRHVSFLRIHQFSNAAARFPRSAFERRLAGFPRIFTPFQWNGCRAPYACSVGSPVRYPLPWFASPGLQTGRAERPQRRPNFFKSTLICAASLCCSFLPRPCMRSTRLSSFCAASRSCA